jgi:hypothetical protein
LNSSHLGIVIDAKYLTLLNTFWMLKDVIYEGAVSFGSDSPPESSPNLFNEKELYGR